MNDICVWEGGGVSTTKGVLLQCNRVRREKVADDKFPIAFTKTSFNLVGYDSQVKTASL